MPHRHNICYITCYITCPNNCYIACYIAYMACYITGYITPSFLFLSLPCPAAALALIKISPTLLQAPLQGHCPLLPACRSPLLPPGLSFSHRDLSWLAPPVAPHPRAHFKAVARQQPPDDCQCCEEALGVCYRQ